jgi:hypothetical protein
MKQQQLKLVAATKNNEPLTVADDAIVQIGLAVPYVIARLDERHIPNILDLQAEDKSGNLLPRTAQDYRNHFAQGHQVLGLFQSDNDSVMARVKAAGKPHPILSSLRGMIMISHHGISASSFISQNFNEKSGLLLQETVKRSLIGGLCIGDGMKGFNLADSLLGHCVSESEKKGSDFTHARVRVGNYCSLDKFLKKDFLITAVGKSPDDASRTVYFVNRSLRNEFNLDLDDTVLANDQKIPDYLNLGYVGTAVDKHRGLLTMTKIQANEL